MKESFSDRLKHAWNAFRSNESRERQMDYRDVGISSGRASGKSYRPATNEKTIVNAIYSRISIDVAAIEIRHVRLDQNGRFKEIINSSLNECLTVSANLDQTGRAFIQDVVISMFDEGHVAIVPVDTSIDPTKSNSYEIESLRTGQIMKWHPKHVTVRVYNDKTGLHEEVVLPKTSVAIVENPLYSVMNEPNGTLKRLTRKLHLMDAIDEQKGSNKLDLIIQLPYAIKSESRKKQAEERRKDIEAQLETSNFGVAYLDGMEKIVQLNRPVENNLFDQVDYLTRMLHSQLGITEPILDGTADENQMLNYYNRTVEPILSAIVESMNKTFLTKTARTQFQRVSFYRDPFKLVPVTEIANMADKFTRNEIMSSNEIRSILGMKPSEDPSADELRNKNLNQSKEAKTAEEETVEDEI